MAKLVLSLDGDVLGHHFLDAARFTIGRRAENNLPIDDSSVSKEHAVIVLVGNDHILEDLGSTNHTYVNGNEIKKHILQHNDVIDIGRYQVRYVNQKAQAGVDFDRTIMMAPPVRRRPAGHEETSPDTVRGESVVAVARAANVVFPLGGVKGLQGTHAGETLELNRPLATFGKEGDQLAVVNRRPAGYSISHVDGKKTALVNGHPIGATSQPLHDGDEIEVGGDKLRFFLKS